MQTRPEIQVGLNVVLFLLVLLFLYVTLAVFPGSPSGARLAGESLTAQPTRRPIHGSISVAEWHSHLA